MKIVNITPHAMSGETHQDSNPNIAVNPRNPNQIVISVLTPDPNNGPNAPLYVSIDGGDTWALRGIVPGNGPEGTLGITVKYGQSSNELYAGVLSGIDSSSTILRTTNPVAGTVMTVLNSQQVGGKQQLYVAATTVASGPDAGKDRLYVGMNDISGPGGQGEETSGQTSIIRQTMDARAAVPVFSSISLDVRPKNLGALQDLIPRQNGPEVRPAVHRDGTVYAVFYSWKSWADSGVDWSSVSSDVVIVRDDNWGQSANPYGSLIDGVDSLAGQRIAIGVPLLINDVIAQERMGGALAIAVDPGNSSIVYVAWGEQPDDPDTGQTPVALKLHLVRSTDRGQTWSNPDLLTIGNGKNPGLAVNDSGQIGFLYQQFTGSDADGPDSHQRWETHLAFSADGVHWSDTLLARVPADMPIRQFFPYIGDYADIMAVGNTFYGVFCANNTPSLPNFPQGVHYQRNHNFATATLSDLHGVPVAASIDPFFFKTEFIPPALQMPSLNSVGIILIILFGIINDGGGVYIDGSGHIHIVGPGNPGPVWEYLVSLAEYRLATASNTKAGLEMQKLALQNVIDLANAQIAQINNRLGQVRGE